MLVPSKWEAIGTPPMRQNVFTVTTLPADLDVLLKALTVRPEALKRQPLACGPVLKLARADSVPVIEKL